MTTGFFFFIFIGLLFWSGFSTFHDLRVETLSKNNKPQLYIKPGRVKGMSFNENDNQTHIIWIIESLRLTNTSSTKPLEIISITLELARNGEEPTKLIPLHPQNRLKLQARSKMTLYGIPEPSEYKYIQPSDSFSMGLIFVEDRKPTLKNPELKLLVRDSSTDKVNEIEYGEIKATKIS